MKGLCDTALEELGGWQERRVSTQTTAKPCVKQEEMFIEGAMGAERRLAPARWEGNTQRQSAVTGPP